MLCIVQTNSHILSNLTLGAIVISTEDKTIKAKKDCTAVGGRARIQARQSESVASVLNHELCCLSSINYYKCSCCVLPPSEFCNISLPIYIVWIWNYKCFKQSGFLPFLTCHKAKYTCHRNKDFQDWHLEITCLPF